MNAAQSDQPRRTMPQLLNPRIQAAADLDAWLAERLRPLRQPSRSETYALMLLLQHHYFYGRWRADASEWEALHRAYEQGFQRLEALLEATDPPLPVVKPQPAAPMREAPFIFGLEPPADAEADPTED